MHTENTPATVDVHHDGDELVTVRIQTPSGVITYQRQERRRTPRDEHIPKLKWQAGMLRNVAPILAACSFKRLLTGWGFVEVQS